MEFHKISEEDLNQLLSKQLKGRVGIDLESTTLEDAEKLIGLDKIPIVNFPTYKRGFIPNRYQLEKYNS